MSNENVAEIVKDVLGDNKCDVCGKEEMVGVAAVPGVPMSVAYGRECLSANAHPVWVLAANTAMVGGYEHAAEWWQEMIDDTLKHLDVSREEFDGMVAQDIEHMREYEKEMLEQASSEDASDRTPDSNEPF